MLKAKKSSNQSYCLLINEDIKLIEHTCKTIVTYDNRTWVKKTVTANLMYQWVRSSGRNCATW